MKEISTRKKEKLTSLNVNILKGGLENSEFYNNVTSKQVKDNLFKRINNTANTLNIEEKDSDQILLDLE